MTSQQQPLIRCVVPTLNSGTTLDFTLDSLMHQGPSVEVLVVDSGSTDDTLRICDRWSVSHLYAPPGNMYEAINLGLDASTAPWLCYVNSDDLVHPGLLPRLASIGQEADCDVVYGDADYIDDAGRYLFSFAAARPSELLRLFRVQVFGFCQPSAVFSAALFRRLGGFDTRYRFGADADFYLRAILGGARFFHVPGPVACFRLHAKQQTARFFQLFEDEKRTLYARAGRASILDRLAFHRWRFRNLPNYVIRRIRTGRLRSFDYHSSSE
ncbi:MAG TPA: glycosyltransferase [Thermoanaerobaculia bacterium]|jgi:hypothetical protein|nr:glycosyltransferase [Thermoanaerobaculia bacterium]